MRPNISTTLKQTLRNVAHQCRPAHILVRAMADKYRQYSATYRSRRLFFADQMIGDYFSCREQEGLISYMPRGREQKLTADGRWERKGRQTISPVKWLRSMFSDRAIRLLKLTEKDFASFSPAFRAHENQYRLTFKETSFEDAYDPNNFVEGIGSCMWDRDVGPFYRSLGAKVLVAENPEGKYLARAILWETVTSVPRMGYSSGEMTLKVMDRIYSSEPWVLTAMKEWARNNGYASLISQSNGNEGRLSLPDGTERISRLSVKIPHDTSCYDFVPYMDTFRWEDCGRLHSFAVAGWTAELNDTDGGVTHQEEDEPYAHDVDGEPIWTESEADEDYRYVDGQYYQEGDDRIVYVERNGEYELCARCVYTNDDRWELRSECVQIDSLWYHTDDEDIVYSSPHGDYYLLEDCVELNYNYYPAWSDYLCQDAYGENQLIANCVKVDGEWYLSDSDDIVQLSDGTWIMREDAVELSGMAASVGGTV